MEPIGVKNLYYARILQTNYVCDVFFYSDHKFL